VESLLAQTVSPDALSEITRTGVVGAFLVVCIYAIIRLYNDLGKERTMRIDDAKAASELVRASTEAIVRWTLAQEERNRSMDEMTVALRALTTRIRKTS
jgi:hypothetical protein